jgi:primosomal protein N' (replication factor Y)
MRGGLGTTRRVRRLRGNATDSERLLWRSLRKHQLGKRFRRQFPIPPYIVDFACIEARLIIEADGGQHAMPGEHDRRDAVLVARGWRVLRFWNNDILKNRQGVLQRIVEVLETSPTPTLPRLRGRGCNVTRA